MAENGTHHRRIYGPVARALHWTMAGLVAVQFIIGITMVSERGILTALTNALALYDVHKLLGVVLLLLVAWRLANRLLRGAPPEEPGLETWQREASALVHAWIYLLLILVPILGWVGISLYPALTLFGSFSLPGLIAPDKAASAPVFVAHAVAAFALIGLVLAHVAAALHHHFIRGDGVLRRMLPKRDD